MELIRFWVVVLTFIGMAAALNVFHIAQVAKIFPSKVIQDIPSKLKSKYMQMDKDDPRLTTSYTFPDVYKTTLYKDFDQKTTVINTYPVREPGTKTVEFLSPLFQELETSTTLVLESLNYTTEYMATPMLNSTLVYPTTVPVQIYDYATLDYQHEKLVYNTKINITQITSTKLMNYTVIDIVENQLPFV